MQVRFERLQNAYSTVMLGPAPAAGLLTPSTPCGSGNETHHSQHTRELQRIMSDSDDFTKLDDPEFLAARRDVLDALDSAPAGEASLELVARYQAMNEEFIRRARISWGGGQ